MRIENRRGVAMVAFLVVVWFVGCDVGADKVEHPRGDEAWELAHERTVDSDEIVAEVDGRVITREDVKAKWRDEPEAEVDEIVDRLVERALLGRRGVAGGYHERPEAFFARKQGLVSALLYEEVERVAEPDVERRDEMLRHIESIRRVPAGLLVSHLAVLVPDEVEDREGEVVEADEEMLEQLYDRGREYLLVARERLDGRVDDAALREVAAEMNEEVVEGRFEVVVDEQMRIPRADEEFDAEHLPSGWTAAVSAFVEGAETVAGDARRGELSEPVESRFGWHLIRVDDVIEARPVDPEAAAAFVDFELETSARRQLFAELLEQWAGDVDMSAYPERLDPASEQPF